MCLILFSFQPDSSTPLLLGANRDEFFSRATQSAGYWSDASTVLAGRDLVAGGTWLGITTNGRFAAVTNVREPIKPGVKLRSRGDLTREFLTGKQSAEAFLSQLQTHADDYAGFNLLLGEFDSETGHQLYYFSNRSEGIRKLDSGIYGLSNHLLDSSWPKVDEGKQRLAQVADTWDQHQPINHQVIRTLLENPAMAADDRLPDTGIAYEREKALSSAFITLDDYGTRASTVLTISNETVAFSEQNYSPSNDGAVNKQEGVRYFQLSPCQPRESALGSTG